MNFEKAENANLLQEMTNAPHRKKASYDNGDDLMDPADMFGGMGGGMGGIDPEILFSMMGNQGGFGGGGFRHAGGGAFPAGGFHGGGFSTGGHSYSFGPGADNSHGGPFSFK